MLKPMNRRVIPFPSSGANGPRGAKNQSPSVLGRYFALGFHERIYVFLMASGLCALMLYFVWRTVQGGVFFKVSSAPFDLLFGLMILYWAFLHHQVQRSNFLKKNAVLLLILGLLLAFVHPVAAGVMAFAASLYGLLFTLRKQEASSFVRYHLLMALVTFTFLLWSGVLISAIIELVTQIFVSLGVTVLNQALYYLTAAIVGAYILLVLAVGLLLGLGGLMGKTPPLPFSTRQVVYWV
ncbi:MAG: hypothetical protein VKJ04_08100 [Vampirovibrionales bacterium]|nr:hypothetical protein [Vampirovibrionales bacterium]